MESKIQKWGNSQGLRFSQAILKKAQMQVGDFVEINVINGQIVIKPSTEKKKYYLKDLLAKMPERYKPEEVDWGKPVGREEW
jgi:antitoxin MazE